MGEGEKQLFQLSFNRFLRVAFQGSRVTSNGGLFLVRELDERLGSVNSSNKTWPTLGQTMRGFHWRTCCGNRFTVAWLVTKM